MYAATDASSFVASLHVRPQKEKVVEGAQGLIWLRTVAIGMGGASHLSASRTTISDPSSASHSTSTCVLAETRPKACVNAS